MAINWVNHTFSANSGYQGDDGDTDWTNPSYAYDGNDSNFATVSLGMFGQSEYLYANGCDVSGYSGTISRVWIGVKWKADNAPYLIQFIGQNTQDYISTFPIMTTADTEQTDWLEITGLDEEWSWSDISSFEYFIVFTAYSSSNISVNQFYIKVEYTTDSVTRTISTVNYDNGSTLSDGDVSWTNPSYFWDSNDSNRASITLPDANTSNTIYGNSHDNSTSGTEKEIKCVNLEYKITLTDYQYTYLYFQYGINDTDEYFQNESSVSTETTLYGYTTLWKSADTYTYGIDSDTWSWSNFDDLYAGLILDNDSGGSVTYYANQVYATVIYYEPSVVSYNSPIPCFRRPS